MFVCLIAEVLFAYIFSVKTLSVLQSRNLNPPTFTLSFPADYMKKIHDTFNNV